MRRINILLLGVLISLFSISVSAATIAANVGDDIAAICQAASAGDIIELQTVGTYTWNQNSSSTGILTVGDLTIQAKAGLASRPTITFTQTSVTSSYWIEYAPTSGGTLTVTGIDWDANNAGYSKFNNAVFLIGSATSQVVKLIVDNCQFRRLMPSSGGVFDYQGISQASGSSLTVTNSTFLIANANVWFDKYASYAAHPTTMSFTNCLFSGASGSATFNSRGDAGLRPDNFTLNHCTFTGGSQDLNLGASAKAVTITNCLFVNSSNASTYTGTNLTQGYNGIYPTVSQVPFLTATYTDNPALDGNGYATTTHTGTDGKNIGYYDSNAAPVVVPTISTSSSMTAFGYAFGAGPSAEKSFTISGANLTGDITLTPPSNYEITTTSGSGYVSSPSTITLTQSGGNVASTTIYVRLKSGLSANTYSANIVAASSGATSSNIAVTGTVTPPAGVVQLASGNVAAAVQAAASGDIIELTTSGGAYSWSTAVDLATQSSVTIRAAAGLAARPVITPTGFFANMILKFSNSAGGTLNISGIEWNVNGPTTTMPMFIQVSTTAGATYNVNVDNCKIYNLKPGVYGAFRYTGGTPGANNLTVTNSIFTLNGTSVYREEYSDYSHPKNMSFTNCYFNGTSYSSGMFYAPAGEGLNAFTFNHCTFNGNNAPDLNITNASGGTCSITNSIFSNNSGTTPNVIANGNLDVNNVGIYYTAGTKASVYPTSGANTLAVDPALDGNGYATASAYTGTGTDGKNIGYYNTAAPSSVVTVTGTTKTGFTYVSGAGPSTEQSFTVGGTNLTANISLTAPTDYEISTGTGGSFAATSPITLTQSGGTVATTTIYIRLKAGLSVASYNTENIAVASTGVSTQNVVCSGSVTAAPSVSLSTSTKSGFTYVSGAGPSSEQSFTVSGANLTANISLTAPTDYEISTGTGGSFAATSPITLTQSGGSVSSTTIYVRLKAGLSVASYNSENVAVASTGVTTQNVACSGSVTSVPTPVVNISSATLSGFSYISGSGPSSEQSFTVSGTNLTANISVTAPTDYEISTGTSGSFSATSPITLTQSGGTVATTTIYVRLKAGLSVASYNSENIAVSSTGVTTQNVACSGTVNDVPSTAVTPATRSGFTYSVGVGPSATQTITVSGGNLQGNITLAPPTDYEISLSSGSGFVANPSTLTLTPTSGSVASTTVYIRLKSGLAVGSYDNEDIVTTASNATTKNVTCSGTVTEHNPLIQIASGDVGAAIASAISGDIIELTTSGGAYSWATAVSLSSSMTITVRAAAGLAVRPVITNTFGGTPITFNDHCVFTLSGVEIHNAAANYFISVSGYTDATWAYTNNFYIDNCKISGLGAYGLLKTVFNHPTLSITNCEFSSNANSVLKWTGYVGKPSTLTVSNCFFKANTGSNAVIVWDASNPPATPTFSHCTFENNTAKDLDLNIAKVPVMTNCLFVGSSQASVIGADLNVSNVGVYPAGNTSYFSTSGASTLTTDPALDANGYATAAAYIGTGSDERNIGYYDQTILMTHNTGSANWGTASSWLDNAVPATGSKVLVKNNLTIDQDANLASVTVNPGSKLTVNSGKNFTATTLTLNSDPSLGTATFVDNGTSTITTATVNQYLSAGRNWYIASPVTTANASVVTSANGNVLYKYDESSNNWVTESGSFNTGAGYVATVGASNAGNYTFTGTLNNGNVSDIPLTRHAGVTKEGFNLVGNPYPSYLNAMTAINNAGSGNIEPTIWYRTKYNSVYYFETVNTTSGVGTNNSGNGAVTAYIPPMQSFWVRVASGKTSATLNFTNAMRSHESGTNRLKAPTAANSNQEILRLQVSNNINSDEAVIYFNSNASDTYDVYDSPKQSNANVSIPEIYTLAGTEQLVINGLNSIQYNAEIPVGFSTGQSGNLTIKASQFSSFDAGTQLILRDNVLNTEQDLTVADYSFTSDITTNNTSRFSLIFKAPSVTTGINLSTNENVWISTNSNNQIVINGIRNGETSVAVYNTLGQQVAAKNLTSNVNLIDTRLVSGVYTITLNSAGKSATTKVIIK